MDSLINDFDASADPAGPDEIRALERDGVICARGAISGEWLDVIEQGIEQALTGASADVDIVETEGEAGRFKFSSMAWPEVDAFRRFIFESNLPDLVWPLLDSATLTLFYDFLLVKEPGSASAATPWHQDHSYYPLHGFKVINSWTALDPIPRDTALQFLAGSHQPGVIYRAVNFDSAGGTYRHERTDMPAVPPIEGDDDAELLSTELEPGDMLVWTSRTLHRAPGNPLPHRRAAFSVNWVGDDVTYHDVAALETYQHPDLSTGDSITGDKFPLVRSR